MLIYPAKIKWVLLDLLVHFKYMCVCVDTCRNILQTYVDGRFIKTYVDGRFIKISCLI